ncbi:trigger factor [Candidatus Magnetominusculus dajiuhuensis]|uniref:trigger factor n=1 Tax=Candidatus Magnetominusculus dajiuhuensis TaxID=3137712 RepID=UPI003B42FD56
MNSVVEDISATKKRITIEASAIEMEGEVQKSLNEIKDRTRIPGFRQGKAPMSLIEKRYRKDVEHNVLESLIPQYYKDAVKAADLTPLLPPVIESQDYKTKGALKLVCSVEVRPRVDSLVYAGLPVNEINVVVTDEEVQTHMNRLSMSKAIYVPVERSVEMEDLVVLDYTTGTDPEPRKDQFIKVGSEAYPESFYTAIIGKNRGDTVEAEAIFPPEHLNSQFSGQTVAFHITIKDIKAVQMPPIDDEFAKDVGFDSLEDLRAHISKTLVEMKRDKAVKAEKGDMIRKLADAYQFDLPETALKQEIESIVSQAKTLDAYKNTPDDEIKAKFHDDAVRSVKIMVLLDIIGEKEDVKATEDDMKERLISMAYASSMSPEALLQYYNTQEGALESLRYSVFREKVVDAIYSKAVVTKKEELQ